jgi:hypothetical protein
LYWNNEDSEQGFVKTLLATISQMRYVTQVRTLPDSANPLPRMVYGVAIVFPGQLRVGSKG